VSLAFDAARRRVFATMLVAFLAAFGAWDHADAEDVCPPDLGNDGCERWLFGRADEELVAVVERKQADIDRRSTFTDRTTAAKAHLLEAQREWLRFRDAECRAAAAISGLISARTAEGLTAACLYRLTRRRIEELSAR
jgi:uncharacterized protein YecT (DUF1311 family)